MPGTGISHVEALDAHPAFRTVKDQILKAGGRLDERRSSPAETRAVLRPLLLQAEAIGQALLATAAQRTPTVPTRSTSRGLLASQPAGPRHRAG
jgi:hypothetical protein